MVFVKNTMGSKDAFIAFWLIFTNQTLCITVKRDIYSVHFKLAILVCSQAYTFVEKVGIQCGSGNPKQPLYS